jgi:thiosulfate dehydrogenase (quinone) large subunit
VDRRHPWDLAEDPEADGNPVGSSTEGTPMSATTDRPETTTTATAVDAVQPVVRSEPARRIIAALRIVIGFNFLWSFLDKAFGLGYNTAAEGAWFAGGSPTQGYLMGASEGWLGPMWAAMAGNPVVDVLFMMALLGLGLAAIFGAGLRLAAGAAVLLSVGFYLSQLPIEAGVATNPVTTAHWYYLLLFLLFPLVDAGRTWGVANIWERFAIVRKAPWLR